MFKYYAIESTFHYIIQPYIDMLTSHELTRYIMAKRCLPKLDIFVKTVV